jgi:phosphoenolpyruvate synthase/pyruvate phosphate dikinase
VRPKEIQRPARDLSVNTIVDLDDMAHADVAAFGAKAANLGELRKLLPSSQVPDGYGIPFRLYDDFMKETGLYEKARAMMGDERFKTDPAYREEKLEAFRKAIKKADVPKAIEAKLTELQNRFPLGTGIRVRSSTNNEDLEGFNGAGLYDSFTHRPDEGPLSKSVKQVWASLWNYRAFEEREFYRIDHFAAAMGVAVHPNSDDEQANGVAVTKNIYDPNWPGFYVNVQVGESLVTNPDPNATPDELLISAIGENGEYETQYIRHSTLTENNQTVLTRSQLDQLTTMMEQIQSHFRQVYDKPETDKRFAMDIEFKIGSDGNLFVKQARPWVDAPAA